MMPKYNTHSLLGGYIYLMKTLSSEQQILIFGWSGLQKLYGEVSLILALENRLEFSKEKATIRGNLGKGQERIK